jgi:hypothetical protein
MEKKITEDEQIFAWENATVTPYDDPISQIIDGFSDYESSGLSFSDFIYDYTDNLKIYPLAEVIQLDLSEPLYALVALHDRKDRKLIIREKNKKLFVRIEGFPLRSPRPPNNTNIV